MNTQAFTEAMQRASQAVQAAAAAIAEIGKAIIDSFKALMKRVYPIYLWAVRNGLIPRRTHSPMMRAKLRRANQRQRNITVALQP